MQWSTLAGFYALKQAGREARRDILAEHMELCQVSVSIQNSAQLQDKSEYNLSRDRTGS
jgi:hypothetical protein